MAGIYIHIPFCKVKCHYCDFHFSTNTNNIGVMTNAIVSEIKMQNAKLKNQTISTLYFGGGTPSILNRKELESILKAVYDNFKFEADAEVTFECNPDDLTDSKLAILKDLGINRLSIGIQSFDDEVLRYMNRAHNSTEALDCLEKAKTIGFDNITLDLIYGIPNRETGYWKNQLDLFEKFEIPHLSAYCLTIEADTVFGNWLKKGKINSVDDKVALEEFQYLMDRMKQMNFDQYEISNFCKSGYISKHNSAYWKDVSYIGIGPSAHSFNGNERMWNVSNNNKYLKAINEGRLDFETETLSPKDKFNEYVLTRLRTKWGLNWNEMFELSQKEDTLAKIEKELKLGNLLKEGDIYVLTDQGKYIADAISARLFI